MMQHRLGFLIGAALVMCWASPPEFSKHSHARVQAAGSKIGARTGPAKIAVLATLSAHELLVGDEQGLFLMRLKAK